MDIQASAEEKKPILRRFAAGLMNFCVRFFYSFTLVWKSSPLILFVMIFVSVVNGVVPVITSLISKNILNSLQEVIVQRSSGTLKVEFFQSGLLHLILSLFLLQIFNRIVGRLSNLASRITGEQVVKYVKLQIMEKAKDIDLMAFDTPAFYEKLENANREAGTRPVTILSNTFTIVSTVISMVSYIVILGAALPLATLAVIGVTIPSAVVNFIYRKKNVTYIKTRSKNRREMNYYADRSVNKDLAKEVRIFGLSDTFIRSFQDAFNRYYLGLRRLIVVENLWHILFLILSSVVNCCCYLYIAWQVYNGVFQIGDYSLYNSALNSIASEITSLINVSATIYEGTLFIDNLIAFLKEKPTVISPALPAPAPARGIGHTIEFRDVSFHYPGCEKNVLSHINLTFHAGENVNLVGLNGAGKTTLLKLMTRLYDPTEGAVCLDGVDLREYRLEDLYELFGIIFQDFGRYAYSAGENIHFGNVRRETVPEELEAAARAANADEYIRALSGGYDTPLTRVFEPDGAELSGGQWQKLAIARAFYGSADVLILDEPTAALDPMAEQEIYNQFARLSEGKTTVFVSHRLSSAVTADKIVVLEHGKVVEEGTHAELMGLGGKYYELFSTQSKNYINLVKAL